MKKRSSIFNFNEEYNPRSVWNARFGELGEVEEEPLYTTEKPGKNNSPTAPRQETTINEIFSNERLGKRSGQEAVQHLERLASTPGQNNEPAPQISLIGKQSPTADNFPRRGNNLLKALHQRITNKDNSISGQKADTAVIGIPSYGTVGKRVGAEALRYVEEMGSAPKSVYDPDKINTNISTASPYPYIDAPGMTLETIDTLLNNMTHEQRDSIEEVYKQYAEDARRDLQTLTGKKIEPVKTVIFDPDFTHVGGPIQYKNDTITAKWNLLDKGENLKRSQMLHEMQHHADKNKLPIRRVVGQNGEEIYNELTNKINNVYETGDDERSKLYFPQGWKKEKEKYNTLYTYKPSNYVLAEIKAINTQLKAHQSGIISLSENALYDLKENLKSWNDYLRLAEEYEKEKGYDSAGYPLR